MKNAALYYDNARHEEKSGNYGSALLFYLSSFCEHFNYFFGSYPTGTVAHIRRIQNALGLSDLDILGMIRSYGELSDDLCRELLWHSFSGNVVEIHSILRRASYE